MIDFDIEGLDDVVKYIKDIEEDVKKVKPMKSAMRKALKPVMEQAKQNIRSGIIHKDDSTKALEESIKIFDTRNTKSSPLMYVGPKVVKGASLTRLLKKKGLEKNKQNSRTVTAGWRSHFLEFGTKKIRGIHYMKKAGDSKGPQASNVMKTQLVKIINRAIKRNNKR